MRTASSTLSFDGVVSIGVVAADVVATAVVATGAVVKAIVALGLSWVDEFSAPQPFKTTAKQMVESMCRIGNPFMWKLKINSATVTVFLKLIFKPMKSCINTLLIPNYENLGRKKIA